jgi:hypothetical protein
MAGHLLRTRVSAKRLQRHLGKASDLIAKDAIRSVAKYSSKVRFEEIKPGSKPPADRGEQAEQAERGRTKGGTAAGQKQGCFRQFSKITGYV